MRISRPLLLLRRSAIRFNGVGPTPESGGGIRMTDDELRLIMSKQPLEPVPEPTPSPLTEISAEEVARIQANQEVFRKLTWRAFRALIALGVSVTFLVFVNKSKAAQKRKERAEAQTESPSDRYRREMKDVGWPLDELEATIATEKADTKAK